MQTVFDTLQKLKGSFRGLGGPADYDEGARV